MPGAPRSHRVGPAGRLEAPALLSAPAAPGQRAISLRPNRGEETKKKKETFLGFKLMYLKYFNLSYLIAIYSTNRYCSDTTKV